MEDKQAALKMWDSAAEGFGKAAIPDENNFTMQLIAQNNMCPPGSRVLDVGCGAGKYAIVLASTEAEAVIATDFSSKMLAQAEQNAARYGVGSIAFSQDDWSQVDIAAKGWQKAFHFVLCSMTPAVFNDTTLQKAIDACSGWLLITKPCRRTNSVIDALNEHLELDPAGGSADSFIPLAMGKLWNMGALVQLSYDKQVWSNSKPLEEAADYYTNRLQISNTLTAAHKTALRKYLTGIAENGIVTEETHTTVTAVYCNLSQV